MAVSFVAAGTPDTTGSTSLDVPYYASLLTDDIAIIFVVARNATWDTVSGWTALNGIGAGGTCSVRTYYKRLTGSESGTVTVTNTGGSGAQGVMIGIRGAVTSDPPIEGADTAGPTSSATETSDTIITTVNDTIGIRLGAIAVTEINAPPSGWTERVDSVGPTFSLTVDTKALASAGTEAASVRTYSGSGTWCVQTFAVMPLAEGGQSAKRVAAVKFAGSYRAPFNLW